MLKYIKISFCLLSIGLSLIASDDSKKPLLELSAVSVAPVTSPKDSLAEDSDNDDPLKLGVGSVRRPGYLPGMRDSIELARARGVKLTNRVSASAAPATGAEDELTDKAKVCGPWNLDEFVKLPHPVSKALAQSVVTPK